MRKFKRGDRVVSVGHTQNCFQQGRAATIKRGASHFVNRLMYVVEWDDRKGWNDPEEPGKGWNIEECELMLLMPGDDDGYEMDA